jgi:hypothetical protein
MGDDNATGDFACTVPDASSPTPEPVELPVAVSIDGGLNWLPTALAYAYLPPPAVTAVEPASLSLSDAAVVTVAGTGFVNSVDLRCRWTFDDEAAVAPLGGGAPLADLVVRATWVSSAQTTGRHEAGG